MEISEKTPLTTEPDDVNGEKPPPVQPPAYLTYHELPPWRYSSEYLLSGYLPASASYAVSVRSLFAWHNETVNIWTHLIGATIFAFLPWHFYSNYNRDVAAGGMANTADLVLVSGYCIGVMICFLFSAGFHLLIGHSPDVARLSRRFDFLGIILFIWSATLPSIYWGYRCDNWWRNCHWTMITLLALICVLTITSARFDAHQARQQRTITFIAFGIMSYVCAIHGVILRGFEFQLRSMSLDWVALMAMLNAMGAAFYVGHVPERWFPKRFDVIGASHQLFHGAVLLAAGAHYVGLCRAFGEVRGGSIQCS